MCRLTLRASRHLLPIPLEIKAKIHSSFQISWLSTVSFIFLCVPSSSGLRWMSFPYLYSTASLPHMVHIWIWLDFPSLDSISINILLGDQRAWPLKPCKWSRNSICYFLLLYNIFCILCSPCVQWIYIIHIHCKQKQWHLLACCLKSVKAHALIHW